MTIGAIHVVNALADVPVTLTEYEMGVAGGTSVDFATDGVLQTPFDPDMEAARRHRLASQLGLDSGAQSEDRGDDDDRRA